MRLKRTILSLFTILLLVGLTACSKPEIPTTQVWNEERQYFTFPGVKCLYYIIEFSVFDKSIALS